MRRTGPAARSLLENAVGACVVWLLVAGFAPGQQVGTKAAVTTSAAVTTTAAATTTATTVPLILPAGLAYDATGGLLFAETGNHLVRRIAPDGTLTTFAGNGTQGFGGDGGLAGAARLDSPTAVALDPAGNVFVADAHNHRIRRVDAGTGVISTFAGTGTAGAGPDGTPAALAALDLPVALAFNSAGDLYFADARTHLIRRILASTGRVQTVAGDGRQGFAGDGGAATSAAIDSPWGLTIDAAGNVFLADTHNQRIRRIDVVTGIMTTLAGTGVAGFSADGTLAARAQVNLPRGLVVDAAGGLFFVDSANQRIRRVDAVTGEIVSVAGAGTQGYGGDNGPAVSALLNSPRAIAVSTAGLPVFSDAGNGRIRGVDNAAIIYTVGGVGGGGAAALALTAPTVVAYGSGTITATLTASPATGSVTLFESNAGALASLSAQTLTGNQASFSSAGLAAAAYRLMATYGGDAGHASAQSNVLGLTVAPAAVLATPAGVSVLFGLAVPALTGTLAGVLPRDVGSVALALTTAATVGSVPGSYPIDAALTGPAAANYSLSEDPADVTVLKAPATATLSGALLAHVATTTTGVPTGTVALIDGAVTYASALLSATGDATFSTVGLSAGTHTLAAAYLGDADFLPVTSVPVVVTTAPAQVPDFTIAAAGPTAITIPKGTAASFTFTVTPIYGALVSEVVLSVSGQPAGATASFKPAFLPPPGSPVSTTLTIQTPTATLWEPRLTDKTILALVGLLPLVGLRRKRFARLLLAGIVAAMLLGASGCSARTIGYPAPAATAYNVVVSATATSATGAVLVHSTGVILTVQ